MLVVTIYGIAGGDKMTWIPPENWRNRKEPPGVHDFDRIEKNILFLKNSLDNGREEIATVFQEMGLDVQTTDSHVTIANEINDSNIGVQIVNPGVSDIYIQKGFHNGEGYVEGDPNLKSENIVHGISIFGVAGTYQGRDVYSGTGNLVQIDTRQLRLTVAGVPFAPTKAFIIGKFEARYATHYTEEPAILTYEYVFLYDTFRPPSQGLVYLREPSQIDWATVSVSGNIQYTSDGFILDIIGTNDLSLHPDNVQQWYCWKE